MENSRAMYSSSLKAKKVLFVFSFFAFLFFHLILTLAFGSSYIVSLLDICLAAALAIAIF